MSQIPMSHVVSARLQKAAYKLGTANPLEYVGPLLKRTFTYPAGSDAYAENALMPGATPCEPSFCEREPNILRFTIMPLAPESSPVSRRNEATREMRRLVGPLFGNNALRWFDERSEEWRTTGSGSRLDYGAFFGTAYDSDGLFASKVYYEMGPQQLNALPQVLRGLVRVVLHHLPSLVPVFTSISCAREHGGHRVTLYHRGLLRVSDLGPLLGALGMAHQLPGIMQVIGVSLGGRFELPERSVLIGLQESAEGPELKLEVMLGRIPDLPAGFVDLLSLGLAERPRELNALRRWLEAFTPEELDLPGRFSVLSIRATPLTPARVSLYLRPIEFEVDQRFQDLANARAQAAAC